MRTVVVVLTLLLLGCAGQRAAEWNRMGLAAGNVGDYKTALDCFAEAVKADPSSARYHTNLAHMLARHGLLQQAADEFRTALRVDPAYRDASRGLEIVSSALQQRAAVAISDELRP